MGLSQPSVLSSTERGIGLGLADSAMMPRAAALAGAGQPPMRAQGPAWRQTELGRAAMQDPFHAVKEEVEHSVTVVIDLHKRWHELSASSKKGDEWEWTACASASEE